MFNNKYNMGGVIRALEQKGLFQSLAEPNLIAINGKEASFLAGGEYPYPVAQAGSGNTTITIQFKEFGVRLSFTPTVLGNDLINLKVKPEVSSLDFANGVSISGFRVPALSTRRTETEVELQDGQTFAIAGLMNNTVSSTMSKIPGIGDIPVLGYLFKSRAYQKQQTELVVMITPQIIRKGGTGVSQGLPSIVTPYLGTPEKAMPPPAPYTGSPRYPATDKPKTTSEVSRRRPRRRRSRNRSRSPSWSWPPLRHSPSSTPPPAPMAVSQAPASQAPAEAPVVKAQPLDPKSMEAEKHQLEEAQKKKAEQDRKNAEAKKVADKKAAEKAAADKKAAAQQAILDKKAADEKAIADKKAAEEKAVADKKAAEQQAAIDKKTAEAKAQQQKLDDERAKREAEVARKNAEADRKQQDEQKKREKTLADAAERLRQAQAAYQAEIDKAKGGTNDKSKGGVQ